jgi:hypothetical protein
MKKIITTLLSIAAIMFVSLRTNAQTTYLELKAYLISEGFSIATEQYADLKQGGTAGHNRTFYSGTSYVIVAVSDDNDVSDVDIYVNYTSGETYMKDTDPSNCAVVQFTPSFKRDMRVVIKNHTSRTPNYASRCRFIVGYK